MPVRSSLRLGLTVLSFWPFMPIVARAPLYGRLLVALMLDRRVPASRKLLIGVAVAYVVSPIDLFLTIQPTPVFGKFPSHADSGRNLRPGGWFLSQTR